MRHRLVLLMDDRLIYGLFHLTIDDFRSRRRANVTIIITLRALMTRRVLDKRIRVMLGIRNDSLGLIKSKINVRRNLRQYIRNVNTIILTRQSTKNLTRRDKNEFEKHNEEDNEAKEEATTNRRDATRDREDDDRGSFDAGFRKLFPLLSILRQFIRTRRFPAAGRYCLAVSGPRLRATNEEFCNFFADTLPLDPQSTTKQQCDPRDANH